MKITAKTDIGLVRTSNQDSYAAGELSNNVSWAVVCDGMGGASGGNIASAQAVKLISEKIATCYHASMSDTSIKNLLISSLESANALVYDMSCKDETLHGMGTTVVAVIRIPGTIYIASVGDSRVYGILKSEIFQLTKDHSMVQSMVEQGEITQDEAKVHPKKNVLTRALGVDASILIDFRQDDIEEDTIILLCTDGLTNYVDDEEILSLSEQSGSYELAEKLVNTANKNGGGDNVTVVIIAN